MKRERIIPLLHAAVFWPVWPWYVRRLTDRCDEPWGVLALLSVAAFLLLYGRPAAAEPDRPRFSLLPAALLTLLYAALFPVLPPLLRAWLAVTALTASLSVCLLGRRFHAGVWGLLTLSLPVMLSFEFYAGYPLRVLTTRLAAILVTLTGIPVNATGAALEWQGGLVSVDAPCAGIRMLWTGAFLTLLLACFRGLRFGQTIIAGSLAATMVLAGNVVRTAALFYIESGIVPAPPWLHTGIGLAAFAITGAGILLAVNWIADRRLAGADPGDGVRSHSVVSPPPPRTEPSPVPLPGVPSSPPPLRGGMHARSVAMLSLVGLLAAAVPYLDTPEGTHTDAFPGWPMELEGHPLRPLPLSEVERRFERGFPGRIGRFTAGERTIILRWVARPSRQLHPAETCFKALGFAVHPASLLRDSEGRLWSAFEARRASESLRVRTQIRDEHGKSWQDVSSWFWAASLARTRGPWWAVTVAETAH